MVFFKFEGTAYKITVEDVKLFPQGYSAIALHPELVQNEPSVLLMDIGGWTVDLMRLDNRVPNAATCRSLELGMIRCLDEIREQVRRDTGLSVTDAQAERVLAGQPYSMDEAARGIIQAGYRAAGLGRDESGLWPESSAGGDPGRRGKRRKAQCQPRRLVGIRLHFAARPVNSLWAGFLPAGRQGERRRR